MQVRIFKQKVRNDMRIRVIIVFFLFILTSGSFLAQDIKSNLRQRKVTIVMIGKNGASPVFIAAYSGARAAAKELGTKYKVDITIDWQTPKIEDAQEQATTIKHFSNLRVNGIAVACSDPNYLTPTINEVVDNGIPVLCFDSDAPKSKRFAYYGTDDVEFGKMLMKEMAVELKWKGVIAILAGNKNSLKQQNRMQGVKDELKKYPKINLVTENIYNNLEIPERAAETVTKAQEMNPNIQGWVFLGSWPLLVKNSIKWNPGEIKLVVSNAIPSELEYLESGYVQGLVGVNYFQIGYKSVELLINKILRNKAPAKEQIHAPLILVSKENVNEWSLNWKKWLIKEAIDH